MLKLLSLFLESRCPFCDRVAYPKGNRTATDFICEYCLKKLLSHQLSQGDRRKYWHDLSLFAWGKYDGQLKRAIALLKYDNNPEIGSLLGKLLGQAWLNSGLNKSLSQVTVVPIPLHQSKLKSRGFNQAEIIAKGFCQRSGYSLNSQALIRTRQTKAMFDLNPEERKKNLQRAFKLGKKLPQHPVLLVDDIYTTGTTVRESATVLQQHEIKVVGVVAIAKAGNNTSSNKFHNR